MIPKIRKLTLFFFIISTICIIADGATNPWSDHPLWVGYASKENGRTPSLSGVIDKNYIAQYLPNDAIIVEAGAYNGNDTIEMAKLWSKSIIYAFEPMPYAYDLLKEKCKNQDNIHLSQAALSNKSGTQKFFLSSGASTGSSSLLPPDKAMNTFHSDISFSEFIDVKTFTLDDWAKSEKVSRVDFLWLDMQGMEPSMLKASPEILKTVKVIYTEVNLAPVYKGAILYPEYKKWLENEGFVLVREDLPWVDGGNALFVRKNK